MGFFTGKQLSKVELFQFIEQNIGSYQLIITINLKLLTMTWNIFIWLHKNTNGKI